MFYTDLRALYILCISLVIEAIFIATKILLYSASTSWSSLIMETPEGSKMKRSRDVGDAGRCSKQSSKRRYGPKKKRFAGNRCTKAKKDGTPVTI